VAKSFQDQLDCAKRELTMRRNCYPGWIKAKKFLTQEKADHEIACMEAIVETLTTLVTGAEGR
jgi:hypothetical protein